MGNIESSGWSGGQANTTYWYVGARTPGQGLIGNGTWTGWIIGMLPVVLWWITVALNFVAGLNSLPGVDFLFSWVQGFNILYLVFSIISVFSVVFCVAFMRPPGSHHHRAWQHKQTDRAVIAEIISIVALSVISLSFYSFKVGNVKTVCNGDLCDLNALVYGTLTFTIMWLCFGLGVQTAMKLWWMVKYSSEVDISTVVSTETQERERLGLNTSQG